MILNMSPSRMGMKEQKIYKKKYYKALKKADKIVDKLHPDYILKEY